MKLVFRAIGIFLVISQVLFAQGTSGTNAKYEYRSLVDMPTAGILEKGFVGITLDNMPNGVVVSKMEVGVFDNLSFGISYGASNLIGKGEPDWYKLPGINVRLRIINETEATPAITFGFDSQGKGRYEDSEHERFEIKSPGFFAAAAKNFEFLGYLSVHGVVNYSLERDDNDKDLNMQIGVEKTVGGKFSVVAEWNFAINDNGSYSFGDGAGFINMGARWSVGEGFTVGLDFRDMLNNKKNIEPSRADRSLFVEYVKAIF
ncbi:MAG: YjbH domain-containing protein [Melioribacteraceae bacterium]|nr:YjbH domain-containing protein [Melioribacteraceae bacterium]